MPPILPTGRSFANKDFKLQDLLIKVLNASAKCNLLGRLIFSPKVPIVELYSKGLLVANALTDLLDHI